MKDIDKTGVYVIRNVIDGKRYVGSTKASFRQRRWQHLHSLRHNKNKNRLLQEAWNKFGERAFVFEISEVTLPEHAAAVEQTIMDYYKSYESKNGYNISHTSDSVRGIKHTPEVRSANSERQRIRHGTPEARLEASLKFKRINGTPDARAANSSRAKIIHGTPESRAANSERAKKRFESPEARAANAERTKKQFDAPEARAEASDRLKARFSDPEELATHSQRIKNFYANESPEDKTSRLLKAKATKEANRLARKQPDVD